MPSSDRAKVEAWVREFGVGPEPNMEFMLDVTDLVALYRAGQVDALEAVQAECERRADITGGSGEYYQGQQIAEESIADWCDDRAAAIRGGE